MTISYGLDPVETETSEMLAALGRGELPAERLHVDFKEEAGRRDRGGKALPEQPHNDRAATALAHEAACMANTDGGGALIVGVADDGTLIGTGLDTEWLRSSIYDKSQRLLTVDVRPVTVRGVRLLVVRSPQSIEPIRINNRITWRVADRCVEVDATTWHSRRMARLRYDWSGEESNVPALDARPVALQIARRYLTESGEPSAQDLAAARDSDLLHRLNVVTSGGNLTNAGVIAFVGRAEPALDYIYREAAAGDSTTRIRQGAQSLLEDVSSVEQAIDAHNPTRHLKRGFAAGQLRELPQHAVREAIVNGVVHRDWATPQPTVVEHVRRSITVTSPGGFIGGVTPQNIITYPSQPRNKALAELFAALRLAEREGVGVDRMVRDMITLGYQQPEIEEIAGPHIRATLVGGRPDEAWIGFLSRLAPTTVRQDLDAVLLLRMLANRGWVDAEHAAPVLQRGLAQAESVVEDLADVEIAGAPVVTPVLGVPDDAAPAWTFSKAARSALDDERLRADRTRRATPRPEIAMDWARARGRISSTELASIVGAAPPNVGPVLRKLEDQGQLEPGRQARRGPGFFYRPAADMGPN